MGWTNVAGWETTAGGPEGISAVIGDNGTYWFEIDWFDTITRWRIGDEVGTTDWVLPSGGGLYMLFALSVALNLVLQRL